MEKITAKVGVNRQFAIPARIYRQIGEPEKFNVEIEGSRVVLTPITVNEMVNETIEMIAKNLRSMGFNDEEVAMRTQELSDTINKYINTFNNRLMH